MRVFGISSSCERGCLVKITTINSFSCSYHYILSMRETRWKVNIINFTISVESPSIIILLILEKVSHKNNAIMIRRYIYTYYRLSLS